MHRAFQDYRYSPRTEKESLFHIDKISPNFNSLGVERLENYVTFVASFWRGTFRREITRSPCRVQTNWIWYWPSRLAAFLPGWVVLSLGFPRGLLLGCRGRHTSHHLITTVTASPGPYTGSCIDSFGVDIGIHSRCSHGSDVSPHPGLTSCWPRWAPSSL